MGPSEGLLELFVQLWEMPMGEGIAVLFVFETRSPVAQALLRCNIRMTLNSCTSASTSKSARIISAVCFDLVRRGGGGKGRLYSSDEVRAWQPACSQD